jgi:very-short-patch-repair endonuclease
MYRFGPLNQQGGERRLNVAVTRARRRLTLVSSFSHVDMDPSRSSAEGVELLRRYLKYAESGGIDLEGAEANTPLNPFEIDVKYRLEQAGLEVIPQYGTSGFRIDFAVPHPTRRGRFALAVEADGASYHSAPTARDRDRLRQQVLERLGWRFHRIWSTDWFNDPQAEAEKVLAAYSKAVAEIDKGQRTVETTDEFEDAEEVVWEYDEPERAGRRPSVRPGGSIGDYSHSQLVALARWIKSDTLLRTEEQMLAEMMDELRFKRRGSRIVEALTLAIREA